MTFRFKGLLFLLLVLSFSFCSLVVAFVMGLEETEPSSIDAVGRTKRFNDRLSPEHYSIALSNFRLWNLFVPESVYSLVLLGMHGCGAGLIWSSKVRHGIVRNFFLAQGLIFPLGWVGIVVLPSTIQSFINGRLDREAIIDVPFIALTAQPVWIATALVIGFAVARENSRRESNGFDAKTVRNVQESGTSAAV